MYNFKHDSSKFKLQISNERYYVNENKRTVTVSAEVRMKVPAIIRRTIDNSQLPNGFNTEELWEFRLCDETMKYTARCSDEDVFDPGKGKKIALAHLEANAYKRFSKSLSRWHERFMSFVSDTSAMCSEFIDKANGAAEHDLRYIDSL